MFFKYILTIIITNNHLNIGNSEDPRFYDYSNSEHMYVHHIIMYNYIAAQDFSDLKGYNDLVILLLRI